MIRRPPKSTHSVADFAHENPQLFSKWKTESNSIICLSVKDESELDTLYKKLSKLTVVTKFYEPDLDNQLTSICLVVEPHIRRKLSYLPLLGKKSKLDQVIHDMSVTPQTDTQSVLDHGISVHEYFLDLIDYLKNNNSKFTWKIPNWLLENKDFILDNLHSDDIIKYYQILHDFGKHYCITIDYEGKRHFPNHAEVSFDTYSKLFDNKIVANLIKNDMVLHTIKSDEVQKFIDENDTKTVLTLLITALCEIHSNAEMFGGIESTSFKIKWKKLDKRGNQILKILKNKQ